MKEDPAKDMKKEEPVMKKENKKNVISKSNCFKNRKD